MAKLYFYYSAMNAGKSSTLIQSSYNYRERGMNTLVLTPAVVTKKAIEVRSRIGLASDAVAFEQADNLLEMVRRQHHQHPLHCILVDEAQFMTRRQVQQLGDVADVLDIPVLAYGLRTDFQGNLFEGASTCSAGQIVWLKSKRSVIAARKPRWSCERTAMATLYATAIK